MPGFVKRAEVGYYAGNAGELALSASLGFNLVNVGNNQVAYTGTLVVRKDMGYSTRASFRRCLTRTCSRRISPGSTPRVNIGCK